MPPDRRRSLPMTLAHRPFPRNLNGQRRLGPESRRAVRWVKTKPAIRGLLRGGDISLERNGTNGQGNGRGIGVQASGSSRPHRGRRAPAPPRRRPSPPSQERKAETKGRTRRPPHPLEVAFL